MTTEGLEMPMRVGISTTIAVKGSDAVQLRKNMRNSREIQQFLLALHSREDEPIVGGPEVGPVRVMAYSDSEDLVKKCGDILAELLGQGVALDDIVLLTPSTVAKSALRSLPEIGGIPISEDELPGTLLTSTLHGFKGLEKPVVILAELGERGERRLVEYLYVGGSRARFRLVLLAVPSVADMLEQLNRPGFAGDFLPWKWRKDHANPEAPLIEAVPD